MKKIIVSFIFSLLIMGSVSVSAAGTTKPNDVGQEASYILGNYHGYKNSYNAGTDANMLFNDNIGLAREGEGFNWFVENTYLEINIEDNFNLWIHPCPDHLVATTINDFNGSLIIEKWDSNKWVAIKDEVQPSGKNEWTKTLSNMQKGKYRFSFKDLPRMDSEWYIEKEKLNETLELNSINKMRIGEEVTVDAILHNVDEIYAEDFTVTYDQDIFEYTGYEEIEGLKVVKPLNTEGILRFIIASKGKDKSIDGSEIIAKLKFRAKQAGVSKIDATKARIANIETEWDLEEDNCGETTITVEGFLDVNRTNEFTLVDLAIDGYYFNILAENTDKEKYDADVVIDGTINDEDLVAIVDEMLNNSNYKPNNK